MRPFGGLIFGYIGDKYGRVYSLRLSLLAMVIPTVLYGLLPNYSSIGITSTILVFVFRIIQGLCVGGEMSTALVYIIEEAPKNMKATLTGYLYAMSCGSYLALIVYALWNASGDVLSENTVEWTWRIAFISSFIIGIFGIYIRKLMPNSYEFEAIQHDHAILQNPISTVFETFYVEFFLLFCGFLAPPVIYYSSIVWLPAYLTSSLKNVEDSYAYDVQLVAGAISIIMCAISGIICDKYFGFYKFVKVFMSITICNILICYTIISITRNIYLMSFCQLILPINTFGAMSCTYFCAIWIPDARIRNTLTGITYNLGMALFVSTLFDVQTYLANISIKFGGMFAGLYIVVLCIITLSSIIYANDCHSWKNYHFYGALNNPHNVHNNGQYQNENDDITDEEDVEYSVI